MAQVRKFNTGGKTFVLGSTTYDASNPEDMKRVQSMGGGIATMINDIVSDPHYDGSFKMYENAEGRIVTEGVPQAIADKHLSSGTQKALQKKASFFNDTFKRQSARNYANDAKDFLDRLYKPDSDSESTPEVKPLYTITGVSDLGPILYDKGEEDKEIFGNYPTNDGIIQQFQFLEDYFWANDEQRKQYDVSALDPNDLNNWILWRKRQGGERIDWKEKFINAGRFADNDPIYGQYKWFGLTPGTSTEIAARKAAVADEAVKKDLAKMKFTWSGAEKEFIKNSDNSFSATDEFYKNHGLTKGGAYWFNDDWNKYQMKDGSNPYSEMLGYILWNDGKIYKQEDILNMLNVTEYHEALNDRDLNRAQSILKTWWDPNIDFNTQPPYGYVVDNIYSDHTWDKKTGRSKNRTGRQLFSDRGVEIFEYWEPIPGDAFGRRQPRYSFVDPTSGNFVENYTLDGLEKRNIATNGALGISKDAYGNFKYQDDITFGDRIYDSLIQDKTYIGNDWQIWKDVRGNDYWFGSKDKEGLVRVPKKIYDDLNNRKAEDSNNSIWYELLNNNTADWNTRREFFYQALKSLYDESRTPEEVIQDLSWYKKLPNQFKLTRDLWRLFTGEPTSFRYPDEIMWMAKWPGLLDHLTNIKKSSNYNPNEYFKNTPVVENSEIQMNKTGGILKFQAGGVKAVHNPKKKPKPVIKNNNNDDWNSADTAELIATGADVVAAIITIADPTNIGGTIASIGATGADLFSDIKRDGFQMKDAGRFGLNLLMDAATLLPIAGDAVAVGRAAKAVKKMMPLLTRAIRLGAITGISQTTIGLLNKISNGEDLTLSDYRSVANAVNGIVSLKKVGMKNAPTTKKVTETFGDLKSTDGKSIKLSSNKLEEIKKADPSLQLTKTKEAIVAEHKRKYSEDRGLSDDEILGKYQIPTKSTSTKWYKPWDRYRIPDLGASKQVKKPMTREEIAAENQSRSSFSQWWHGTGNLQQNYQRQLMLGEFPGTKVVERIEYKPQFPAGYDIQLPGMKKYKIPTRHQLFVPKEEGALVPMAEVRIKDIEPGKRQYLNAANLLEIQNEEPQSYTPEPFVNLPYYTLGLKKGGVLKGQYGLNSVRTQLLKQIDTKDVLRAIKSPVTEQSFGLSDGMISGKNLVQAAMTEAFQKKAAADYQKAAEERNALRHKSPAQFATDFGSSVYDAKARERLKKAINSDLTFSAFPDSNDNDYLKQAQRERNKNLVTQLAAADYQKRLGHQFANEAENALLKGMSVSPDLLKGQRHIDYRGDQVEKLGASLLTSINQLNTADGGLNRSAKLGMLGQIGQLGMEDIAKKSEARSSQLNADNQMRMQQSIYDAQTESQNNQIRANAELSKIQTKQGADNTHNVTIANILNNRSAEDTSRLNAMAQTKANLEMRALKLDELAALTTDENTRKYYLKQAANLRNQKTVDMWMSAGGYAPQSARNGAKLSSTERMLINKDKLVARAIEKINDNTMKILLKAMS